MNRFRKLMACAVLSALCLTAILPTKASASTYTATKVSAVALSMPYHYTISVQNNSLVISGNAPSYLDNGNFVVELIEPISYKNQSINSSGLATLERRIIDYGSLDIQKQLHPTVIKSIVQPLVKTGHLENVPQIALSGLSDGLYTLRTKFGSNFFDYCYLYCDDIIIVVQGGKASLQVIPTYFRGTMFGDGDLTYDGYSLDPYNIHTAINLE